MYINIKEIQIYSKQHMIIQLFTNFKTNKQKCGIDELTKPIISKLEIPQFSTMFMQEYLDQSQKSSESILFCFPNLWKNAILCLMWRILGITMWMVKGRGWCGLSSIKAHPAQSAHQAGGVTVTCVVSVDIVLIFVSAFRFWLCYIFIWNMWIFLFSMIKKWWTR